MSLPKTLYLIDTSAASRAEHDPQVAPIIDALVEEGIAATCVFTDLEAAWSARQARRVADVAALRVETMRNLAVTEVIARRAREVQVLLAGRGVHRKVGPMDLLTAAVAEAHGAVVLHYDADFEHIASVTGQRQQWIVPRGSVS